MSIVKLRLELDLPALHDNALHGEVIFCFLYNTSLVLEKELCPYPTQKIGEAIILVYEEDRETKRTETQNTVQT